MVKYISGFYK